MSAVHGRVALVTGGAGAIGSAICRELVANGGHRVAVCDISADGAQRVADEIGGIAVALDVTDPASVAAAVQTVAQQLGPIAVCVNAAGWDELHPFVETDEAFDEKVMQINLRGVIRVMRAVLPGMLEAGFGRIVNIASDAGKVGSLQESVYSGAKGGVIAFSKAIARETARRGVTVNAICPGPVDTPLLQGMIATGEEGEKVMSALARAVPMRRIGRPDDIAPAVAFLASDGAGYITGQALSVSGGLTMA